MAVAAVVPALAPSGQLPKLTRGKHLLAVSPKLFLPSLCVKLSLIVFSTRRQVLDTAKAAADLLQLPVSAAALRPSLHRCCCKHACSMMQQ